MIAGSLEIQMAANMARLADDMGKAKTMVGSSMKSIESAVASAKAALGALGIGLGAGYFVSLIKGSIDAMDHLNDLNKTTSIAVETLAGLKVAAKQSGGDLDSIATSINKLSVEMGKSPEKFKALGVSAKDPLEAFKQLSDIFVKLEDPQQRAAVMAAALGKAWAGAAPLLAEGGQKIGEMVERGTKLSGITSDLTRQADELNDKWVLLGGTGGMLTRLVGPMLPMLNQLADDMLKVQEKSEGLDASFKPMAETLRVLVLLWGNFAFTFTQFGIAIAGVGAQVEAFTSGGWKAFIETRQLVTKVLLEERAALDKWEEGILKIGTKGASAPGAPGADPAAAAAAAAKAKAFIGDGAGGGDAGIAKALQEGMDEEVRIMSEIAQLTNDFRANERALEQAHYDERNRILIEAYDREQAEAIAHGAELIAIDEAISENKKREQEAQIANAQTFLGNLAGLMNTSSRKAFEVGKAASLAQAAVSGALAVMEAWRAGMTTIGPWAPFVAAAYAAAAAANALNLMNNIRKQTFGGGGGATPVFSAQPGTSIPSAPPTQIGRESQSSQTVVNVTVQGNIVGNQQFVDDMLIPAIRDAVDNRDFVIIGVNSRQAANFAT